MDLTWFKLLPSCPFRPDLAYKVVDVSGCVLKRRKAWYTQGHAETNLNELSVTRRHKTLMVGVPRLWPPQASPIHYMLVGNISGLGFCS